MFCSLQRIGRWLAVILAFAVFAAAPARAEDAPPEKIALVIANSAYDPHVGTLPGVPHDRERIEAALRGIGFDIISLGDGTQAQMEAAILEFRDRMQTAPEGSTGFFYYTGHGLATGPGRHFFTPVDFDMPAMQTEGVEAQSISVEGALSLMLFEGRRQLVLAFDTNRSYLPDGSKGFNVVGENGELLHPPEIYQLWATRIGDYAYETPDGSYFTMALSQALLTPGHTVTEVFAEVQSAVIEQSEGQQFPEAIISTSRPLILNPIDDESELPIVTAPTKSIPLVTSSASGAPRAEALAPELALELAVWQSAVSLNSVEAMQDFIAKFPDSVLIDQARLRLKALSERPPAPEPEYELVQEIFTPAHRFDGPARIALLIGNKNYAPNLNDLTNPHNDVLLLKDRLLDAGFEVMLYRDADPDRMGEALSEFAVRLSKEPEDTPPVAFFYYSGHGFAPEENGPNYLAPVGMKLTSENDLIRALSIEKVIEYVQAFEPSFAFYVLDACRNDPGLPAAADGTKSAGGAKGLSRVDWVGGALVAYATAPGETAYDAPDQTIGPYAKALADALGEPGRNATDVFKTAQRAVYFESKKTQTPWISDGLMQDFYFLPED